MGHWGARGLGTPHRGGIGLGPRLAILFFSLSILFATAMWLVDFLLRDSIEAWAESKAVNMATRAIALAVAEGLAPQIQSEHLAAPVTDGAGRIIGFHYEMGEINRLEAEAATLIQGKLQSLSQERLPLPLGQLTGLHWLAGSGPSIPIRIVPTGHVRTAPRSDFRAAGINQILHRIYVDVEVKMRVVAPLVEAEFPVHQQIVLAERVFMGEVPHFYAQWGEPRVRDLSEAF